MFDPAHELHPSSNGEPACPGYAWLDLVSMARYEDGGGLKRGQLYGSARTLASRWNWSRSKASRWLSTQRDAKRVTTETQAGRKASVITICNYDSYQQYDENTETQAGHKRDAKCEPSGTRRSKEQSEQTYIDGFTTFWNVYPKRAGNNPKASAGRLFTKRCQNGIEVSTLIDGAKRYCAYCDARGITGTEYVLMAQTWLGDKTEGWTQDWASNNGGRYTPDLPDLRTFGQ